ncbi:MAG: hypothetical protein J7L30_04105 [Methanophagales archaeon]|nr:hypothetical protein [Methanophagales archaeon]
MHAEGIGVRRRRERWKRQKAPQASEWRREGSGGVSVRVSGCGRATYLNRDAFNFTTVSGRWQRRT